MISLLSARVWLASVLLMLAGFAAVPAHAASFDCAKAATAVEKAICSDQALGRWDEQLRDSYRTLLDNAPSASLPALREAQRGWLKQRNQCAAADLDACLSDAMKQRVKALDASIADEQVALDHVIVGIPSDPAAAARALRGYGGPLPSAWLIYLHEYEPEAGVTADEAHQRLAVALAGLDGDSYSRDLYLDIESKKYSKDGNAPLTLLRMLIERAGYQNYGNARPYVHCFIFARQGEAAYRAFGPLYGSSRDGQAPVCPPQGGLFELASWQRLREAIEPELDREAARTGTIRYGYYAEWSIQELRATMSPRDFLKPLSGQREDDPEQDIRDWQDSDSWPAKEREAVLAALAPATHATAGWLRSQRGFDDADAATAADGIVRAWLGGRMSFVSGNH